MKQNLGDYIKQLESQTTKQFMIPRIPIVIRLDGKSFHTFTKGLKRPYDERLSQLMVDTTKYVMKQTNPVFAYTQSDEITLVYYNENIESDIIYGGKLHKLTSIIPGFATAFFNKKLGEYIPEKKDDMIVFDGRVFNTPSLLDAANTVLWREIDATKNSITMASLSVYSHKEIDGKNSSQKQEMLFEKGINWNDYPNFFKKGTYLKRKLNTETNRSEIVELELPPLNKITNRVEVLFNGDSPILYSDITETIDGKEIVKPTKKPQNKSDLKNMIFEEISIYGTNVNLNHIDVSDIDDMSFLFSSIDFNGDISKWDVSNVKNMAFMFYGSTFNGDISNWDTKSVRSVYHMFYESDFKGQFKLNDHVSYNELSNSRSPIK